MGMGVGAGGGWLAGRMAGKAWIGQKWLSNE